MFIKTRKYFPLYVFCLFLVSFVLTGCGGGDSAAPSSSVPSPSGSSSGIAVDPYIHGAVFQEVAPSGAILQESTASEADGHFQFQRNLTIGSTIRMKSTAKGMHNNLPFAGILKREVNGNEVMVVSPLTTLVANGLTEAETVALLLDSGIEDLSTNDLYDDPMAGLSNLLALSDDDLDKLQAAIAVNQFLLLQGDYEMSKAEVDAFKENLADMVKLVQLVVNKTVLEKALEDISGPMADAQVTPTMGASIKAGVNIIDAAVSRHMADPAKDPLEEAGEMQVYMDELALMYSVQEHRGEPGVEAQILNGNLPAIDNLSRPNIDNLQNPPQGPGGPIIAEAGPDQNVQVGSEVLLSGSFDIEDEFEEDEISFFWSFESKPAGSTAQLFDHRSQFPSFVADSAGTYVLSLTVYLEDEASTPDTVTIYASAGDNLPPVANSGQDQHVTTGETVELNGSASFDNDSDALSYSWSFESRPSGSSANLSTLFGVSSSFVADVDGTYVVSLTVNDGLLDSTPDSVIITAAAGNVPPVANAGPNQEVLAGTTVTLNGASSNDTDNDLLTYSWSLTVKPAGSSAVLSNSSVVNPVFVADVAGSYQVRLVVNDGTVGSVPDFVTITVVTGNVMPVANAGPNQNVAAGSDVILDGSGSSDADNNLLTYNWSFTAKPVGSSAVLSSSSSVNPGFSADLAGTYTVRLIVNDGTVNSSADFVTVNAANNNVPPTANAGPDQNVFVFDLVSLDASGSNDPDADPLSYSWSLTSKPLGSSATLSASNAVDPSFVADFAGTYTIRLVVNDGTVNSAPDTLTVTASNSNVAPTANGGIDQDVTAGDTVTLDASGSSDPDSDPLSYTWSFSSKPSGSTASFDDSTAVGPSFIADLAGSYVVRLVVNDGSVDSAPDTVTVSAASPPMSCTACHGQPPAVGAHAVHIVLASVNGDCNTCHGNNNHMNGTVDVNISSTYDAKSAGSPAWNGTSCSGVSCHGGKATPAWTGGTINVNTQCTSCHASGTSQYNSYSSGEHSLHLGFATCTTCHNTTTLAVNHFTNLDTTNMEGPASGTIGGGSTSISTYNSGPGTCVTCHGTNRAW